ncbi:unnamed protein product [Dibothriocephalus latus]|uniref:Uncharacterized protein n=1 Tax=Dibothriocephalus latus TaxID=60516 RepID=A0A3P6S772_DIBLA|nr:unnamed protein product [Dibothriocephalus latus]
MCLFILGNVASMQSLSGYIILFWLARLCFAICLLMGFAFLFRFCVVSRSIGPKLLMIKKMVVGDLLPFLGVILLFWLAFTIFLVVQISKHPYGYEDIGFGIYLRNAFFAMFGEFNLDDNVEELGRKADSRRYERQIISWQKCCSLDFLRQNVLTVRMALENSKFGLKDSKRKGIFAARNESETKAGHRDDDIRNDTKRALETVAALQNTFNELSDVLGAVNPEVSL